ncbi:hypothetical protein [Agromyces sp. NPDC058064]|uniref:hypothetical protein n=1 Tax=Agromyces sp. NPDC058064 TaxID=3346322 RepID=UPI0036DD4E7B
MTGCTAQAPEGDALYQDGEQRFTNMWDAMHSVLSAVHDGEWAVPVGGYGAAPGACTASSSEGFRFEYRRSWASDDLDPQAISDAAVAAFESLSLQPETNVFGEGDQEEWNVIAEGDPVGRAVVTVRMDLQTVDVTTLTTCAPGDPVALDAMVFDDPDMSSEAWRRMPATERPDSVPMFFFPVDGPVFWNEDKTPVDPQPVITDPPQAPFGP